MMRGLLAALPLCFAIAGCTTSELKVTQVEPATGTVSGQENVVIHGSGFKPGKTSCTVRFGSKEASNVTILSENRIQVTTPANDSGPTSVLVTFEDGRTFKLDNGFQYKVPDQTKARDIFLSGSPKGAAPAKK